MTLDFFQCCFSSAIFLSNWYLISSICCSLRGGFPPLSYPSLFPLLFWTYWQFSSWFEITWFLLTKKQERLRSFSFFCLFICFFNDRRRRLLKRLHQIHSSSERHIYLAWMLTSCLIYNMWLGSEETDQFNKQQQKHPNAGGVVTVQNDLNASFGMFLTGSL